MSYPVPLIAVNRQDLINAMMSGAIGAALSLDFALFLPEMAGREFVVIEGQGHS